ncbi:hypothetical protein YC2023_121911 [Brassica napus]
MRFFECLFLLLLLLLCSTSISTHFRSRKKMPTNLELRRSQHHFGKAQKPSRAVKGRHDFSAPNSAVLTLKRAAEIYGANYAANSTISERPRNHQGRLKDELRRPQTISERPRNHQGRLKDVAIFRHQFQPNYATHRPFRKGPETIKGGTTPPTDHFGKAQKPSRAVKGRRDFSAPISAELRRPQHHFGKAQKPSRAVKGRTTPPTDHFGKAQKPSRAVKGRRDFSAPNSAVLTLKRAAEIYGANYAAHSTISERPRNHQGRLKDELRRPQHHFGKAQKPSRAVKGRHDFSAPNSAVLTLKRAAEIYGANYAAHSTISERPRNHQGRLKGELRRPQHHFGKAQKPSRAVKGRHDFSAPNSAVLTLKWAAEIYGA